MEKRKFIHLPAADRHMLTDLLVQAGFLDQQGYVTKAGEEIISGESYMTGSFADANLLGTDIKPGYVRLVYRLSQRWLEYVKAFQAQEGLVALGFNIGIVAKAVVYIYDSDTHNEDALLMMADTEEVQS